jgi:phosphate transport system protein
MNQGRQAFDREIQALEHDLLEMGSRAETMVGLAADALADLNVPTAMEVIRLDDAVDAQDLAIESQCLRVLALHQPQASDLRLVGSVMKIVTDIERIGDLAVDVAKIALKVDKELGSSGAIDIRRMSGTARTMFRESLVAFARRDLDRVATVERLEDEVDALYREYRAQIFADMISEGANVVCSGWLLMAVHHVERIADHAMNIAERVHFMVTGEIRPKPQVA